MVTSISWLPGFSQKHVGKAGSILVVSRVKQFQRNPNNGEEDALEMLLSGAGICTNVLLSQLGSKSALQLECIYLREDCAGNSKKGNNGS